MADFTIILRTISQHIDLCATVRRIDDGKYWNETMRTWDVDYPTGVNARTPFAEVSLGLYNATAHFDPQHGVTYEVSANVVDQTPPYPMTLLSKVRRVYSSETKTALQLVNDIQAALRLPQNPDFTYPHAKLVLAQLNKAIELMVEKCEWPEMELVGSLMTIPGVDTYAIRPINNSMVDIIRSLQISDHAPLVRRADQDFKARKKRNTTNSEPLDYRISARAGGVLIIEVTPTPDVAYEVEYDVMLQAVALTVVSDIPLFNNQTVYLGGLAFAKKEQGEMYQDDMAVFQAKLQMQAENQAEPNWGDVETV